MKLLSGVGITRTVLVALGSVTLIIAFVAAFNAQSYGISRRWFKYNRNIKTHLFQGEQLHPWKYGDIRKIWPDVYEAPSFIPPTITIKSPCGLGQALCPPPQPGEVRSALAMNRRRTHRPNRIDDTDDPIDNNIRNPMYSIKEYAEKQRNFTNFRFEPNKGAYLIPAWGVDFGGTSLYALFVSPFFLLSVFMYGMTVGETESVSRSLDIVVHALGAVFVLIGALLIVASAVYPEIYLKDKAQSDALVLGLRVERWKLYLHHVDQDLVEETVQKFYKIKEGSARDIMNELMSEAIKNHRRDTNFVMKLVAAGLTVLYSITFGVMVVMLIICGRKKTKKVEPVMPAPVVVVPEPLPVEEVPEKVVEVVEGAEGAEGDPVAVPEVPAPEVVA